MNIFVLTIFIIELEIYLFYYLLETILMSVGLTQELEHEVQQDNKAEKHDKNQDEKDDKELQKLAQTEEIVSFKTTDTAYWSMHGNYMWKL